MKWDDDDDDDDDAQNLLVLDLFVVCPALSEPIGAIQPDPTRSSPIEPCLTLSNMMESFESVCPGLRRLSCSIEPDQTRSNPIKPDQTRFKSINPDEITCLLVPAQLESIEAIEPDQTQPKPIQHDQTRSNLIPRRPCPLFFRDSL